MPKNFFKKIFQKYPYFLLSHFKQVKGLSSEANFPPHEL